ncbi:uncharacterized protein LOC141617286 [Silene latifolia]|uniref:uncharacterized protein LOC141617286 n=1 Tax=Silene latifolia TaxID=37657 RepID=UPI003D777989
MGGVGVDVRASWGYERVREWVEDVWRELEHEEIETFMIGVWAIWEMRNKLLFDKEVVNVERVIRRVRELQRELDDVEKEGEERRSSSGKEVEQRRVSKTDQRKAWKRPGREWVKINMDAGVKEGNGMGLGVVCRNHEGEVMWGATERRRAEFEVRIAEAEAVLVALRMAKRRGHQYVIMESDCKEVIEALQRRKSGRNEFFAVIEDILELCDGFAQVVWSFISRNSNSVAHELSHFSSIGSKVVFDATSIPRCIANFVIIDRLYSQ